MQKYRDTVTDRNGNALQGISVLVQNYPALTTATIYSDDGITPVANPMTTDAYGTFQFYAADGRYSITISGSNVTTTVVNDVPLLDDPEDGSPIVIDGGTISNSALTNITLDGTPGSNLARYTVLAGSGGSALSGHIASGAGAVATTVQAKLRETISVKDFGAVGDGVADDTAAIQAAWTAADTKNLFFPAGTYLVTTALSGPLAMLVGAGQGRTILDFQSFTGIDGLTFTAPATYDRQGGVCGMTIRAKSANGRYAIVTPRAADLNNLRPKYKFDDLAFTGTANTTGFAQNYGWEWMIDHGDCWGSEISNIDALGTYIIATDPAGQAEQGFLRLHGLQGLMSVRVSNVTTHNCKNGIEIKDRVFWYFHNVDIAQSHKGIYTTRDDGTTVYGEGVIHGVIINAQLRGVDIEDRIATMCNHLTINRSNSGYDHGAEWIGLRLEDANLCNFNNIKIYAGEKSGGGRFTGNHVGIDVVGGSTLTFSNYTPQALDRCFRTSTSAETTNIPNGISITNVASETSAVGSVIFDFQTARRVQVDNVSWSSGYVPATVVQAGDTTTARNIQISNTGPLGASATVGTTGRPEYITDLGAASDEKLWVWVNDNGDLRLQSRSDTEATAVNAILINRTGTVIDQTELRGTALKLNNTTMAFYGGTPAAKPAITGSRGANAALASLLTQLAALGLITDSTS